LRWKTRKKEKEETKRKEHSTVNGQQTKQHVAPAKQLAFLSGQLLLYDLFLWYVFLPSPTATVA